MDNEVKQYLAVDGTLYMDLDLPKTGLNENFTRSYYTSSGRWGEFRRAGWRFDHRSGKYVWLIIRVCVPAVM